MHMRHSNPSPLRHHKVMLICHVESYYVFACTILLLFHKLVFVSPFFVYHFLSLKSQIFMSVTVCFLFWPSRWCASCYNKLPLQFIIFSRIVVLLVWTKCLELCWIVQFVGFQEHEDEHYYFYIHPVYVT